MSPRLRIYLLLVAGLAASLLALHLPPQWESLWLHYAAWTAICLVSETLWLATLSGGGTSSMAATANLATVMLWGPAAAMWIVGGSTLLANVFIQRKPWVRGVFNTSQSVVTMWAAGEVMVVLGAPRMGFQAAGTPFGEHLMLTMVLPFLGLVFVYMMVNRALVSLAVAWSTERPYRGVLREDWFYRERLVDDSALFLLAPLVVIAFVAIRYVGLLLFYAPLRMIYESMRRYANLRSAQNLLIHSERMRAKGEMAAEIGHELRNQLVAIKGRAQLLLREDERQQYGNVSRHAQIILEQSNRMETMSKGLMDFSRAELKVERVDLNALVRRSIEFVSPQKRFDGVEWDQQLAAGLPEMRADPGQLQQVLINLFMNAADAMNGAESPRRSIQVVSLFDEAARRVRITVSDTGPGIPATHRARVFEPQFTTKTEGHGFGLSTSYRIITNHGGSIECADAPQGGARFVIALPLDGPGSWG